MSNWSLWGGNLHNLNFVIRTQETMAAFFEKWILYLKFKETGGYFQYRSWFSKYCIAYRTLKRKLSANLYQISLVVVCTCFGFTQHKQQHKSGPHSFLTERLIAFLTTECVLFSAKQNKIISRIYIYFSVVSFLEALSPLK